MNVTGKRTFYTKYDKAFLTAVLIRFEASGLSQAKFAESIDVSEALISQYFSKKKNPSWGIVAKIAKKLNISLDELLKLNG